MYADKTRKWTATLINWRENGYRGDWPLFLSLHACYQLEIVATLIYNIMVHVTSTIGQVGGCTSVVEPPKYQ